MSVPYGHSFGKLLYEFLMIKVMYRKMIYGLCLLLLFVACREEMQESHEEMVVEGWIESGGAPVVLLTRTFVVELGEHADGETSVVLPWG